MVLPLYDQSDLISQQFMRPRARDKKLQEEWATPLKSIDDIQEVELVAWKLFSLFSF